MARNPRTLEADRALIEKIGVANLARKLETSIQVVSNWKVRGIPPEVKLDHPDLFLAHLFRGKRTAGARA